MAISTVLASSHFFHTVKKWLDARTVQESAKALSLRLVLFGIFEAKMAKKARRKENILFSLRLKDFGQKGAFLAKILETQGILGQNSLRLKDFGQNP